MQIVILGGGTVGYAVAETLCNSHHDVVVVEKDRQQAERLKELEVQVIIGSASQSNILFSANVGESDLCLAVTGSEETNILAASIAQKMGAKRTIARVYTPIFENEDASASFNYRDFFNIDCLMSLEKLTALEMVHLVCRTHSQVLDVTNHGELEVQEVEIIDNSPVLGKTLKELRLPTEVRVILLKRGVEAQLVSATDSFQVGDVVSLVGKADDIGNVIKKYFKTKTYPKQRVIIMGGGETGFYIAQILQKSRYEITLFENDPERCDFLATHLNSSVSVVKANGLNRRDLEENIVGSADSFIACTGDDENNIMGAVEAKDLGAKHVFAIVSRPDYAAVVKNLGIDRVISPRTVMINRIRGFLNTGPVIMWMPLTSQPNIDVMEIKAVSGAPVCQNTIRNLGLPARCLIVGVNRKQTANQRRVVQVPGPDFQIQPDDVVIVLTPYQDYEQVLAKFNSPK